MMKTKLFFILALAVWAWPTPAGAQGKAQPDSLEIPAPFGTHALEMLVNQEAGVEVISSVGAPGMTPTIHVRGLGVLPGIQPVYVVDGMRRRNLDGIAPEAIEKIEVLKDAAAMGLWGPDAAAGVVVVTTRRASQEGFHAGYGFVGGVQSLAYVPEKMSLADWQTLDPAHYSSISYIESEQPVPETSFVQRHHLYAQYGGDKLSAYTGLSVLDNDGPYPDRADSERRYAASWSVEYRPLRWLSFETTGRWGQSTVRSAPDKWLQSYLVSLPILYGVPYGDGNLHTNRSNQTETVVQGKVEIRPFAGMFLRGTGGYSRQEDLTAKGSWGYDVFTAESGNVGRKWYQWGAEAGWSGVWRGHRLRLGMTFQRVTEKQEYRILRGSNRYTDTMGLTRGDEEHMEEYFLLPAYEKYLAAGGGLDGYNASKLSYVNDDSPELKWKQSVLSAGYDWKGRYRADFSYFRLWEDDLFSSEGYRTPAVTLGWTLSEEPLMRRALPTWWTKWSVKASWSETDPYIPLLDDLSRWVGPNVLPVGAFTSGASTTARHRDLTSTASFQMGRTTLDLSASWYINDDDLTRYYAYYISGQGIDTHPVSGDDLVFSLRNEGVELSGALKGNSGPFRYAVSAHLTFYENQVKFSENLKNSVVAFAWQEKSPLYLKDGERIGGALVYPFKEGTYNLSYDDQEWLGSVFPTMTGGIQAMVGWQNWQLTVSGHGDRGQTIRHATMFDALSRHFLETMGENAQWYFRNNDFTRSDYSVLDGSFFRIDQIRLDYTMSSWKGVRLNLFTSLDNWFLFTRYPGSDPEMALHTTGFGCETASFPTSKRVMFGLEVGF